MPLLKPHITVDDLRIAWGAQVLMEHVTFQVERGTVFAILGGSGCGKSSLLRYLIGLEQPHAGKIKIDGVGEPHRYEGIPPFGVLFQSGALFSSMTLAENLALPLTAWTDPVQWWGLSQPAQSRGLGGFASICRASRWNGAGVARASCRGQSCG
jgi:phospholipid/cholesterol/gamma-HCH transport system ATP-binding protein